MPRDYRSRTHPHEKSMGSYELAVWRDAMAMAAALAEDLTDELDMSLGQIRQHYQAIPVDKVAEFEEANWSLIGDYLGKTESQRPAFARRLLKGRNSTTVILFNVLCIIAALRAKRLFELRDVYRMSLAPGRGNRVTAAGAYRFSVEAAALADFSWPEEPFDAMCIYDFDDED